MAVFHPVQIKCSCGNAFTADAARSLNIRRNPAVRVSILNGEFHRVKCPACGTMLTIERPFYYSDPDRGAVFLVQPRGARLNHTSDGQRLSRQDKACELINGGKAPAQVRVIYGLDELREKLVAQDANLDDRHVELLKLLVLQDHPFLMHTPRLQLVLTAASPTQLSFVAYHHNQPRSYEVQLSSFLANNFISQPKIIDTWLGKSAHAAPLFAPDRRWVNFRRWTTRYSALDTLRNYAATVSAGGSVNLKSQDFKAMCEMLPRAGALSAAAKTDLQTLFDYAKRLKDSQAQDLLFEVRYGIALDDEWGTNQSTTDIDTIWNLLRNVPANNIEGNTRLKEIDLIGGGGGLYQWSGVIQIGNDELGNQERFEDVLRHEVGHAVHANKDTLIDPWLKSEFGWQRFARTQAGIDAWINLMGGWTAWGPVSATERIQISNALVQALGNGSSWDPGTRPTFPASHPWNRPNFGPRLAVEGSHADWYNSFEGWHRANGLAFFLNYWYAELLVIKESTLELIKKMPSRYAAMSHFEFFAELYSLYYDLDDPGRTVVPTKTATWLDANIGQAGMGMPAPSPASPNAAPGAAPYKKPTTKRAPKSPPKTAAKKSAPAKPRKK
ncbi:MAG: CpXC domain-containing protein [Rhodocyclaceae bacterium]